jgi:chromosomal replication initiation ATPase DnaA
MTRPDGYLIGGLSVERIVDETARGFGVTTADLLGSGKHRHVAMARCCAMALVRQSTGWSWPEMGRFFDRDESSVRAAVAKVMADDELGEAVRIIASELAPHPTLFAVEDAS